MSRLAAIRERKQALQAQRPQLLGAVRARHAETAGQVATLLLVAGAARLARHWFTRLVRKRD